MEGEVKLDVDIDDIRQLIAAVCRANIAALTYQENTFVLRLKNDAAIATSFVSNSSKADAPIDSASAPNKPEVTIITSECIGRFALPHSDHDYRQFQEGDRVEAGDIVCLIRTGECLSAVRSPVAGRLGRRLKEQGVVVGYGDALFEIA